MFPTFLLIAGLICGALAEDDTFRLPPIYIVNHQDIDLVVPAEAFSANYSNYSGSVDINFQVGKTLSFIQQIDFLSCFVIKILVLYCLILADY